MQKIIISLMSLLLMTSCVNDFLNVTPVSNISTSNFWKSDNDVRSALNSAYGDLQVNFANNGGKSYIACLELRSDNFLGTSNGVGTTAQSVNMNNLSVVDKSADWSNYYKIISTCNYVLYYVPKMQGLEVANKNHYLAEAYFLRALAYFYIYRLWGDAPLVTTPVLKLNAITRPSRDSKALIMTQIKSDLADAEKLMKPKAVDLYRFSPGALYALATDVAMWNKDYTEALRCSQKVYDLGYTVGDFSQAFLSGSTSSNIFTLKWLYANDGVCYYIYNLCTTAATGVVSKKVNDSWNAWGVDLRMGLSMNKSTYTTNVNAPGGSPLLKWTPVGTALALTADLYLPIYRLEDIILLRAEALNQMGDFSGAVTEINKVRVGHGGLTAIDLNKYISYANDIDKKYAIESDILQERQFELIGEGKRWFDLMRTGRAIAVMNKFYDDIQLTYGFSNFKKYTDEWQLYWPIYYNLLVENDNLKQTGNY